MTMACCDSCDFDDKQNIALQTNGIETTSVRALFWGEQCVTWHIIKLRSIGLSIPSHYQHFDRQSVLNGRYSSDSHYLGDNVIEIKGATPHSDMSTYAICYCAQTDVRLRMNTGFTEVICNNVRGWFGPVIVFATDPANHMRNAITDDAELAMDAISWYAFICLPTLLTRFSSYIRSKPFPFRFFYEPPSPIVTVSFRSNVTMPNEIISNISFDSDGYADIEQDDECSRQLRIRFAGQKSSILPSRSKSRRIHFPNRQYQRGLYRLFVPRVCQWYPRRSRFDQSL